MKIEFGGGTILDAGIKAGLQLFEDAK